MRRPILVLLCVVLPALALAHIEVESNGIANTSQEVTLSVTHGCSGNDTSSVRTTIPSSVSTVRAMNSDFGKATVQVDGTGAPVSVTWQRATADLLPVDTNFYKLTMRLKLPNAPFTVLYFPTEQTCLTADGGVLVTEWTNTSGMAPGPNDPEEAPAVVIVPAHKPGWNKFTVPVAVDELGLFFNDAQIVWKGAAAFSPNAHVTELIAGTAGVTTLSALQANDEIWVKY